MTTSGLTDDELEQIELRYQSATPGPWFVRRFDDDVAMSLITVSTIPDTGLVERWPDFDHGEIVAATLVQDPRYVDAADHKWNENALFIAHARIDIPHLVAEIRRLRAQGAGGQVDAR